MKTHLSHRISTVNVIQLVNGSPAIDAYPNTAAGRRAALAHFHQIVAEQRMEEEYNGGSVADRDGLIQTYLPEVKREFPTIAKANYSDDDSYDVVILKSYT